jgi:hypothetical protein
MCVETTKTLYCRQQRDAPSFAEFKRNTADYYHLTDCCGRQFKHLIADYCHLTVCCGRH